MKYTESHYFWIYLLLDGIFFSLCCFSIFLINPSKKWKSEKSVQPEINSEVMTFGVLHPWNPIIFSFLNHQKMQVTAEDDEIQMIQRGAAEVEKNTGTNII